MLLLKFKNPIAQATPTPDTERIRGQADFAETLLEAKVLLFVEKFQYFDNAEAEEMLSTTHLDTRTSTQTL